MGLKILHSADWHLGSPFASAPADQRGWLKAELGKIPEKAAEVCRREHCDLVLLAGDILDGTAGRETIDGLKKALSDCAVPVFIAPGNHDFCGPGSPWLEESWPGNVHIFTGGLRSMAVPELDCRVYGAGYRSMDCGPLLEGFQAEGDERYCVAVLHGDPVTRHSPCCPVTAAQVRDSGLDYLALGHIHKAGAFRAGATLCGWPGCPMGRGWDETGEKGLYIVALDETAEIRQVTLGAPCFYELEADIGGGAADALEALLPGGGSGDLYRVTLTGTGEVDMEALKRRFARFLYLELRDRRSPPLDLWADLDEDTLEGVYFRLLREKLEAASPEEKGSITKAAELSRRLLAGREVTLP